MKKNIADNLLILVVLLTLNSCNDSKEVNPDVGECEKEILDYPNCKITRTQFSSSFADESYQYYFINDKLDRFVFFINGNYWSTKQFEYNQNGDLRYMFGSDSTGNITDTICQYFINNGLLSTYIHLSPNSNDTLSVLNYFYKDSCLSEVISDMDGSKRRFKVSVDNYGNVLSVKLIEENGGPPQNSYEVSMSYDNKLNPFYKLPDFIDFIYFNQNNITEIRETIDGVTNVNSNPSFIYRADNLIDSRVDLVGSDSLLAEYFYDCQ